MGATVPAMALGLTSVLSRLTSDLRRPPFRNVAYLVSQCRPTGDSHRMSIQCRSVVRRLVVAMQCCQRTLGRTGLILGYLALGGHLRGRAFDRVAIFDFIIHQPLVLQM